MKLASLLCSLAIMAVLGAILLPRLVAAKRCAEATVARIWTQHNERIDYLASGALEDPRAQHTTEKDVDDATRYFTTLGFR